MKTKTLSRRDFLKLGGLTLPLSALVTSAAAPYIASHVVINRQVFYVGEATMKAPPPPTAEPMDTTELFTADLGFTRKIITSQYKKVEYETFPDAYGFRKNGCGPAMLATATKYFTYKKDGVIPDVTTGDIYKLLYKKEVVDRTGYVHRVIDWDFATYFDGLDIAINEFLPLGQLVKAERMTFDWGARYIQLVNKFDWPELFEKAEAVCDAGGAIILFGIKHGGGHLVLCTDFKSEKGKGRTVVTDSYWPSSFETVIANWLPEDVIDPSNPQLGPQHGLLGLMSLTPITAETDKSNDRVK